MKLLGRSTAPGEVELAAALEQARSELLRIEGEAATAIGNARGGVTLAQGRLDEWRRSLVADHARAWRGHAEALRTQAEAVGDETSIISVTTFSADGSVVTKPELAFTRQLRLDAAARADWQAQHLEDRLSVDDLGGDVLQQLCSELEPLPDVDLVPA
jgi:hypothetical protein